jgi:Peptidase A4 family
MRPRAVVRSIGGVSALVVALAIGASPALAHAARHAPKHRLGAGTSTNWSGYAVDGTGATSVVGTWTQPPVSCGIGETSWSSPWVGIDGDNSGTVEQTGTDGDCQNGTPVYYAWYEMYPKSLVKIPITVSANDSFTGSVSYGSGGFILTLTDLTSGKSYTTTQSSKKARRSSVEWIMEGPSNGLLSNFGTLPFSGASGNISGQSVAPSSSNALAITMVAGSTQRAVPSSASGGSFSVAWAHS